MAKRLFASVVISLMILSGFAVSANAQDTTGNTGDCIPGYDSSSFTWGPAGPSPCSLDEAVEVLDLGAVDGSPVDLYVTVVNGRPGNPTPIGWIVATSGTEEAGTMFSANFLPEGVTIDFDPRAGTVNGEYQFVDFREDWRRALLMSDGSFEGLKATVYWTPVDWAGLTPQSGSGSSESTTMPTPDSNGNGASEGTVTVGGDATENSNIGNSTDCTPEGAAALFSANGAPLSEASSYRQESDTQVVFSAGTAYGSFEVPDGYYVDYDGAIDGSDGKAEAGDTVPSGTVFTLNCTS